jgi:uncharacterized membrane protein YraQ (UPF0718 family)
LAFSRNASQQAERALHAAPAWITLFLVLIALAAYAGALSGLLPAWAGSFIDQVSSFSAVFLGIFIEAAPFLLLGTLASGIVEVFISRDDLARWLPRQKGLAVVAGGLMGLFFPVCECGVVPFARRLMQKGVPPAVGITVLLAAPVINPIVIASTLAAFGPGPIFWGRLGLTLTIAILTGLVFSLQSQPNSLLRAAQPVHISLDPVLDGMAAPPTMGERIRRTLVVAVDEFFEMGRFLVIGALLAALMQTIVRQAFLVEIGQGPVLSVLAMTALAVMLSICSTVDAFIALAFTGTFASGGLLAFLVFGPMVDIKSTLMFFSVFKARTVAYLVLLPLVLTLIATIFINFFLPG